MNIGFHVERDYARKNKANPRPALPQHVCAAQGWLESHGFRSGTYQVFIAGPRQMKVTLTDEEADAMREYVAGSGISVYAHGTYMDLPWSGEPSKKFVKRFIQNELALCARAGIRGLVIHLGKTPHDVVVEQLAQVMPVEPPSGGHESTTLYLETPAVLPANSHYETPAKLAQLFASLRESPGVDHDRIGLCIDTAHLWASGVDLTTYEQAAAWFEELERHSDVIPHDRVMIHLNDNQHERGSGRDHHATLLRGRIWGEYQDCPQSSGLAAVVDYVERHGTPVILERKPKEELLTDYAVLAQLTRRVRLD